jgi:dienelactone hydrolase
VATVKTRPFELIGTDSGPLRGEVRTSAGGRDRPAVVICHGFKGFKDWGFFPHVALRLARSGITAVTFNFSGSGVGADGESFSEPERFSRSTPSGDLRDLATVWNALARGALAADLSRPTKLGVFGHSRGGAAAIIHAARHANCGAIVTWAAISSYLRWGPRTLATWRESGSLDIVNARTGEVLPLGLDYLEDLDRNADALDPATAASQVFAPWLLVHGSVDETVPVREAKLLFANARRDVARLEIVEAGSHTMGARHPWGGWTPQLERAVDLTLAWFGRQLL